MNNATDAVCPIFVAHDNSDRFEQIGSGVLIKVADKTFLLTAAHVTDWMAKGTLCMPIHNALEEITGSVASLCIQQGQTRNADKLDMAYFLLSDDLAREVEKCFLVLNRKEYWLTDNTLEGDLYTFTGFPLSKAKTIDEQTFSSELFSYTGEAAIDAKYEKLKLSTDTNLLINFRIKKAIDPETQLKSRPPHPKGISGGAIYRWSKYQPKTLTRTLVGIGHSYLSNHNCLIGTKLPLYISFIAANHPELFPQKEQLKPNTIPLYMALVAYKREEWDLLMSQFDDADNMQRSWSQWRNDAEYGIEHMDRSGRVIIPIELSANEISEYCAENRLPNTGKSRIELVNKKLFSMIKESEIVKI